MKGLPDRVSGVRVKWKWFVSGQMDGRKVIGDDRHGRGRKRWSKGLMHLMHQVKGDEARVKGGS